MAEGDLEGFDLVVGFELMHVATAVVEGRASPERTFTLPELVGLLEAIPAHPLEGSIERARLSIHQANAARPPDYRTRALPEIADPLNRPEPVQRAIAAEVRDLVTRFAGILFA
jgi:hypothetical protein